MGEGPVRATVNFRGQVQGVGFRIMADELARDYPVTGYVRNLQDGSVDLVAEGDREAIEGLMAAVHRAMAGFIHGFDTAWGPASGEFNGFGIRR